MCAYILARFLFHARCLPTCFLLPKTGGPLTPESGRALKTCEGNFFVDHTCIGKAL